ncbi:MAG: L-serine ammonia-lyase, iron-sulfur-dependent, subunit alpha [Lachnospiraceae bacterium]|nr:L-serine ammonia-lyase, iron-sulfur-dependent, subunit alpha [Lachnospiraceae bacterium]
MTEELYQKYLQVLREELIPAMGCTEPIAIAYAAALAVKVLGTKPEKAVVRASANIIKNAKSVNVPNTGGKKGIEAAAAAGIAAGDPDRELEVLAGVREDQLPEIDRVLAELPISVVRSEKPYIFDIQVELTAGEHQAKAELAGGHTNVVLLQKDEEIYVYKEYSENSAVSSASSDRDFLSVEGIVEFADRAELRDVQEVLQRQIDCNMAIAEEGISGKWGARIGATLLRAYGEEVHNKAKSYAAAGSDARMSGCELPVVINSGSGNQGMTASVPVIVYAREMKASEELLFRSLLVANLVTIHLKTGIGKLSAYCGATSAGCGAGAGICYLHGGKTHEIAHTIVNALAINSGMICDGAKPSCAAKIASAVEAGLLGWQMQRGGTEFFDGEGIVTKGVENTIRNVGLLARLGMAETDREILRIMMKEEPERGIIKPCD